MIEFSAVSKVFPDGTRAVDESSAIDLQVTLSAAGLVALHVHGPVPGARVV